MTTPPNEPTIRRGGIYAAPTRLVVFSLIVTTVLVWYYWPFLSGQQSFYQSDVTYYFEPFSRFIAERWRAGQLPLWNPYLYCGMAQVAVPSPGPMYIPAAVFCFFPYSQGLAIYLIFHQLIAAVGGFLLAASLGWGLLAALICGIGVGLSGYMFALQDNYTLVSTIAWFPLLLYGLRSIGASYTRSNVWSFAVAAFSCGGMLSAGRPELFVPAFLIAVGYIGCTAFSAWREDSLAKPAAILSAVRLLALGCGGLLAMPVLLPAAEWARLSPRAHGLELKWVLMWSANWYDTLNMICAQPLGDITVLGSKYLNMVAARQNALPYVTSSYVGPVVLTLAIWSLFDRGWRWRWLVVAIFVGMLLMALGENTPFAPFVCNLSPAFSAFRYPEKLMVFPALSLVFLAAHGACIAARQEVPRVAQVSTTVLWALLLITGLVFYFTPGLSQLTLQFPWLAKQTVNLADMHSAQLLFGKSFMVTALLGLLVNANYLAYVRDKLTRPIFVVLIAVMLAMSVMMPARAFLRHGAAGDFYARKDPFADKVRDRLVDPSGWIRQRALTLYFDPLTPGKGYIERQKLGFQQGFYLYARQLMLPNNNVDYKIPYSFGYEAAEVGLYKKWFSSALSMSTQNRDGNVTDRSDAPMARFCNFTGTTRVLTQVFRHHEDNLVPLLDPKLFDLIDEDKQLNVRTYSPKVTRSRVYFSGPLKQISWDEFYRRMVAPDSGDIYFGPKVLPEQVNMTYIDEPPPAGIDTSCLCMGDMMVTLTDEQPEHVIAKVSTNKPRMMVLSDQYYPGWNAWVDGKPSKIYRINFFARGVVVPAGEHRVDFRYEPLSVRLSLFISGAALLFLILLFVFAGVRLKRSDDSPVDVGKVL